MKYPLVLTSDGIFAYMQRCLESDEQYANVSPYVRRNFTLFRFHSEKLARASAGKSPTDISLKSIYDALAMTGELGTEEIRELVALERQAREELNFKEIDFGNEEECEPLGIVSWSRALCEDFSVQLLAGAARRAIQEYYLQGAAMIGAALGGPALMPYVEWILCRSVALGIKRLYFIARDGFILMRMADVLIKKLGLDVRTFYIHGSRRVWRMPSYQGLEGELGDLVGWSHPYRINSAEDLAEVLQIPVEKLRPYLLPEFAEKGYRFSFEELCACVMFLDKSAEFRYLLKESLSARHQLVVDYLQQEIDTSDDKFAFVELAGGGLTQICLAGIMKDFYKGRIQTFFYKLDRTREFNNDCVFYVFFPSVLRNNLVIEMICRAPEGQTEGYYREGGKILPLKKDGEADLYRERGYEDYIRGIDVFTELYAESAERFRPEPGIKASLACIKFISRREDSDATEFFLGLPNRVTGREDKIFSYAPLLTKTMVRDIFIRHVGSNPWSYYPGTDFDMSVKKSQPFIQCKVKKYQEKAWEIRERWLKMFRPKGQKQRTMNGWWRCPYSLLGRRVVLYGAGKRGQRWYKDLSADKAIEVVQWLDKDYLALKDELPVTGDMDSLGQVSFEWLLVDFANQKLLESVIEELQEHGVAPEKIYTRQKISDWVSSWINYLHV